MAIENRLEIFENLRHLENSGELGDPLSDAPAIDLAVCFRDFLDVEKISRSVRHSLHDDKVFRSGDEQRKTSDVHSERSLDTLPFERQRPEGNVGVGSARLMPYEQHARPSRKLQGVGLSWFEPEGPPGGEKALPAVGIEQDDCVHVPSRPRRSEKRSGYAANDRVGSFFGLEPAREVAEA